MSDFVSERLALFNDKLIALRTSLPLLLLSDDLESENVMLKCSPSLKRTFTKSQNLVWG